MKLHKGLMSISSFSDYCGTTRQTMQYYDHIGLLRPMRIGNQGYRYYHPLQGHEVRLIRSLQRSGCTLNEVKDIIDSTDLDILQERISEKRKALELEQQRIQREQVFLDRLSFIFNWAGHLPDDTPTLVRSLNPLHLADVVQVEQCEPFTTSYFEMILRFAEYYRLHHSVQVYPYVLYVDPQELAQGLRFSRVLAFPEDINSPSENSLTVEPGQYLCFRSYPEQRQKLRPEVYGILRRYMAEHGLRPAGGALELPLCIPRGLRRDAHRFAIVFALQVVPQDEGGDKA